MDYPTVKSGTRDRTSWAQPSGILKGREDTEFVEELFQETRWKNPATFLTMKLDRRSAKTEDVHWFTDERVPYTDTVNYSTGYATSATGLVVDNYSHFKVGNVVRVDSTGENLLVQSVASSYIGVVRNIGQSTEAWTTKLAAIPDGSWLRIIGSAFEPGHVAAVAKTTLDVERLNYMQEFRHTVDILERSRATQLKGPQDLATQESKVSDDHKDEIEMTFFDGKPMRNDGTAYETSMTAPGLAGGLEHYIEEYGDSDKVEDQTDLTEAEFHSYLEKVLNKHDEIICYCPPALRHGLDKWGITKQNTFDKTTMLGMKIGHWQSSEGDVIFLTHDYLKAHDSSSWNRAFFVEQSQLAMYFKSEIGSTKYREVLIANGVTKEAWEYHTICTFVYGLMTRHGRLRFKTISA